MYSRDADSGKDGSPADPVLDHEMSDQHHQEACNFCGGSVVDGSMVICVSCNSNMHFWCIGGAEGLKEVPKGREARHHHPHPVLIATDYVVAACRFCASGDPHTDTVLTQSLEVDDAGEVTALVAAIQILRHLKGVRDVLMDANMMCCLSPAKSGRNLLEWLPKGFVVSDETPASEQNLAAEQHMVNAERLVNGLRTTVAQLESRSARLSPQRLLELSKHVSVFDPAILEKTKSDPVSPLLVLLNALVLVTDQSTPNDRGKLRTILEAEHKRAEDGQQPLPLAADCAKKHAAYLAEGRTSKITPLFLIQVVQEWECDATSCEQIRRMTEHEMILHLRAPNGPKVGDSHHLRSVMNNWMTVQLPSASPCPRYADEPSHKVSTILQKITYFLPEVFLISFASQEQAEHIDLPEFIDLTTYADGAILHSELLPSQLKSVRFDDELNIFRLFAVHMISPSKSAHETFLIVDGYWTRFGSAPRPFEGTASHPQVALNRGGVPRYAVYLKQSEAHLPKDTSGGSTEGFTLCKGGSDPGSKAVVYDGFGPPFACPAAHAEGCVKTFNTAQEAHAHTTSHADENGVVEARLQVFQAAMESLLKGPLLHRTETGEAVPVDVDPLLCAVNVKLAKNQFSFKIDEGMAVLRALDKRGWKIRVSGDGIDGSVSLRD